MRAALASTLGHPTWWAIALAGFLVRGGLIVIVLPILSIPTAAGITTTLAPSVEALVLGGPSIEGTIVVSLLVTLVLCVLAIAGWLGSWLDLGLVREAGADPDLELGLSTESLSGRSASSAAAFGIRLVAHAPTLLALTFAGVRIVGATYDELLAPGEAGVPLAIRVIGRAPEAVTLVVAAWLLGETVGPLVARRHAYGESLGAAARRSLRQLAGPAGLATLVVTCAVVLAVAVPFLLASGRAWLHLRAVLLDGGDAVQLSTALVLLVATWLLGLAVLGASLAWRATAWTVEVARRAGVAADNSTAPATEVARR
jgi:hypothetical protein